MAATVKESGITIKCVSLTIIFLMCSAYVITEYIYLYPTVDLQSIMITKATNNTYKSEENISINNSNEINQHNMSLNMFLKKYNISILIRYLREIESSIYFENITNKHPDINQIYLTDKSPHYYNGEFDLSPGKTCKVLRCAYHCTSHSIVDKAQFNEWTLRINQTQLNKDTLEFLNTLQTRYNIYTNLYIKFINNLFLYQSPYIKPINIYYHGNSHLKQIHQGTVCLMEYIEINLFNNTFNKAIHSYHPTIEKLNGSIPVEYDFNNTLCGQYPNIIDKFPCQRDIERNGIFISQDNKDSIFNQRVRENIKMCESKRLYSQFADKSRIFYRFNHAERDKRMIKTINLVKHFIKKKKRAFNEFNDNNTLLDHEIKNLDVIVFNVGNKPRYNIDKLLLNDLQALHHLNKPIILLSTWWDWSHDEVPKIYEDKPRLEQLYKDYPNLIVINLYRRNHVKLLKWNKESLPFHYGKYRWILAEGEPTGHMCQPGVPEHNILAITELINLLIRIYK